MFFDIAQSSYVLTGGEMYLQLETSVLLMLCAVCVIANTGGRYSLVKREIKKSEKIIGGEPATNADAPYQVYLKVNGKYICGGSLITPQHILTAAHCLVDVAENPYLPLTVVAGTDARSKRGVEKRASEIFIHPDFGGYTPTNDVGIIKLEEPFELSDSIKTINLPKEPSKAGDDVTVTGYGRYSPFALRASDHLKKLDSVVYDCDNFIGKYLGLVGNGDLCVKNPPGEGICNGDSGGPLVNDKGEVVGIASRVFGCASRTPDIYTGVHSYLKFINDAINGTYDDSSEENTRWIPPSYDILDLLLGRRLTHRYYFFF